MRAAVDCVAAIAMTGVVIALPALAKAPPKGFTPTLPPVAIIAPAARIADGSIFNASSGYAALVEGARARNVGDVLTIQLLETTTSSKSASSKTQRNGGASITPPTSGPFAINPNALNASAQSSFNGQGGAAQTSNFSGNVSVTIAEVRANGTAVVRGEKRMMFSQGQEWIQLVGIIRLSDVDANNAIASARVADAHMEYSGNGAVQRAGREGWLSQFFNTISPF
jgi:flagellar L-ring protein precursor FlgH